MFIKRPSQPGAAFAEAAGLSWLGEAGAPVARVIEVSEGYLATETIETVAPTPESAFEAGVALAGIHALGAPGFGSPPAGWDGPNYIGTQVELCIPRESWFDFYASQRVLFFVEKAVPVGTLPLSDGHAVARLMDDLKSVDFPGEPARIHGDLWAGNLLFGKDGPVFIDPAAHGGHPVTDLAMLDLFGAPYLESIFSGYASAGDAPAGWRELIPLHQLHPLAVHAVTHGAGYGRELMRCAGRVRRALL